MALERRRRDAVKGKDLVWPGRLARRSDGYSLLEILIILFILSLASAIAVPSLARTMDAVSLRAQSSQVAAQMQRFRHAAIVTGSVIEFGPYGNCTAETVPDHRVTALGLPDGWDIEADCIRFFASGMCEAGRLRLVAPTGRTAVFTIDPPDCVPVRM